VAGAGVWGLSDISSAATSPFLLNFKVSKHRVKNTHYADGCRAKLWQLSLPLICAKGELESKE